MSKSWGLGFVSCAPLLFRRKRGLVLIRKGYSQYGSLPSVTFETTFNIQDTNMTEFLLEDTTENRQTQSCLRQAQALAGRVSGEHSTRAAHAGQGSHRSFGKGRAGQGWVPNVGQGF